jgi:hypothetical protein
MPMEPFEVGDHGYVSLREVRILRITRSGYIVQEVAEKKRSKDSDPFLIHPMCLNREKPRGPHVKYPHEPPD